MRWNAESRKRVLGHLPVAAALALALAAEFSTSAVAEIVRFTPALLVEQIFTDNVRGSSGDRDADGVTSVGLRLNIDISSARVEAALSGAVYYNEFWATNDLDSANGDGSAGGRITLWTDRLVIDGQASRQEVFLTPATTSGAALAPGGAQTKQTTYSVGPLLTVPVLNLADLSVRASYSSVMFDTAQTAPLLPPITDITAKHLAARITTGQRSSSYELIGTAERLETDNGFMVKNAVGHAILHLTESIDAIGRYGYEHLEDPSLPDIKGARWAVGARYMLAQNSTIHVEYGRRFDSENWFGELEVLLTPRLTLAAQYTDIMAPAQLSLLRPLDDLFNEQGDLDIGTPPNRVVVDPALVDQTVRDKVMNASLSYVRGQATYSLFARHADRMVPTLGISDKIYSVNVEWSEILSRSMTGRASLGFFDNYEPPVGGDEFQQYRMQVGFVYVLTPRATLNGDYYWSLNSSAGGGADAQENVIRVGLSQTF